MAKLNPENLLRLLRENPRIGSATLCRLLGGVNRSTLARALKLLGEAVVCRGDARRTSYALRRTLRGSAKTIPLYRIDESGRGHEIGQLYLVAPAGSALSFSEPFEWPLGDEMRDGWFEGLPYPLMDMRPQGFLGRNFAHCHALDLVVSENPDEWPDDDVAHVMSLMGHDQPGNLILGEVAYRRYQAQHRTGERHFLSDVEIEGAYPALSASALARGVAGSSAAGEFPKFTACRQLGSRQTDVIVKFSGADNSSAVRRWADLLVCEHLALKVLAAQLGIASAESAIYQHAGRTFLEVVRFDRHGESGRSAVCSLGSINSALVGASVTSWPKVAQALCDAGWLSAEDVGRVTLLWWFGKLIANTDMHEGNLAFRPGLSLAPAYDMLPMMYAPLRGGELPDRGYLPELPLPGEVNLWKKAAAAALEYWQCCASDTRVSQGFQAIAAKNATILGQAIGLP